MIMDCSRNQRKRAQSAGEKKATGQGGFSKTMYQIGLSTMTCHQSVRNMPTVSKLAPRFSNNENVAPIDPTPLEVVGTRALEHIKAIHALSMAKSNLLVRMALFDRVFNDHQRVTKHSPMYGQLYLFCFDQFKEKDRARREAYNAKRRLESAARKVGGVNV